MRSTTALTTAAAALALLLAGAAPAGAQGTSSDADTGGDTGGLTGQMTTTPKAKSDDTTGTAGESVESGDVSATPEEAAGGERDCEATEKWDEQAMACVPK